MSVCTYSIYLFLCMCVYIYRWRETSETTPFPRHWQTFFLSFFFSYLFLVLTFSAKHRADVQKRRRAAEEGCTQRAGDSGPAHLTVMGWVSSRPGEAVRFLCCSHWEVTLVVVGLHGKLEWKQQHMCWWHGWWDREQGWAQALHSGKEAHPSRPPRNLWTWRGAIRHLTGHQGHSTPFANIMLSH